MVRQLVAALMRPAARYDYVAADLGFACGLIGAGLLLWLLPDGHFAAPYYRYLYPSGAVGDAVGLVLTAVGVVLTVPRQVWGPPWPGIHTVCAILSGGAAFGLGLAGFGGALATGSPPVLSWFLLCVGLARIFTAAWRPWHSLIGQIWLEAIAERPTSGDGSGA